MKIDNKNFTAHCDTYDKLRKEMDKLRELASKEKETINEIVGDKTYEYGDWLFLVSRVKGRINYKEIPELKNVDLNEYRDPIHTKRALLSVEKQKENKRLWLESIKKKKKGRNEQ